MLVLSSLTPEVVTHASKQGAVLPHSSYSPMMPIKTQNKLYKSLLMHLRAATIVLSSIADEGVTL